MTQRSGWLGGLAGSGFSRNELRLSDFNQFIIPYQLYDTIVAIRYPPTLPRLPASLLYPYLPYLGFGSWF